ncbi:hypothetical protein [Streptosporangium sp. NPDC048865]|uniref:hypothetical protein n=1 Tax=Streptosporangium sp. NPDC048865 TaxID=3155766 RepID=UPI00342E2252
MGSLSIFFPEPIGLYFRQASDAFLRVASSFFPRSITLPPPGSGSGMSTPFSRMHRANFSPSACDDAEGDAEGAAEAAVLPASPAEATFAPPACPHPASAAKETTATAVTYLFITIPFVWEQV